MTSITEHPASRNHISGKQLRRGAPVTRALAGIAAHNGGLNVRGLSYRQAEKLTGIRRTLIAIVDKAGPDAIEALEKGKTSLARLRAAQESKSQSERVTRYIARVGLFPVLDALARLQGPSFNVADCVLAAFGDDVMRDVLDRVTAPHPHRD